MEPRIYQLTYISAATAPFADKDLRALLTKARTHNRRLGVSGLLVHAGGSFLQILEGAESTVTPLFQKISADTRHAKVLRVFASYEPARSFAEWTMGYVEPRSDLGHVPGFNDFLNAGLAHTHFTPELATKLRDLALQFRVGRWRQQVSAA